MERPIDDADAVEIPGTDREVVTVSKRAQQVGKIRGIVREVRIHLADGVGAGRDGMPQAVDIGHAQPARTRPMQHFDASVGLACERVGDLPGSVRRAIVDDEQAGKLVLKDQAGDPLEIGALVVGWQNDQQVHRAAALRLGLSTIRRQRPSRAAGRRRP